MKARLLVVPVLIFAAALVAPGANREMIELQRDVAQLQQQITTLQSSLDQRLIAIQVMMQQTLDASNKANASMGGIEKTFGDQIKAQSKQVVAPVAAVGSKIDTMSADMQTLTEAVKDLTSRMAKIQQQLVDVQTAVRTMAAPAPPPPVNTMPSAAAPITSNQPSNQPPVPATVLWQNAVRDMKSGKPDLALAEFQDYLKYYGATEVAPRAQFNIGQIHYAQGNLDVAIRDFDMVIEKYPSNSVTPDAFFMKGKSLVQSGQRDKGVQEFQALIEKFPRSDLAVSARAQLKALGLNPPARPPRRR